MEITENLHIGVIYMFTNKINGKKYIGQTVNERRRYLEHKRGKDKANYHLDNAIKKYGIEAFNYEILNTIIASSKEGLIQQLNRWEVHYINKYNATNYDYGYNVAVGGGANGLGKQYWLGKHHTEETKKKLSKIHKGSFLSDEIKKKISIASNRMWASEEYRKKHKEGMGKYFDNPNLKHHLAKKTIQYDLDGNFVKEFESLTEAALKMNCDKALIMRVCQGKAKTAKGYKWKYKEKEGTN